MTPLKKLRGRLNLWVNDLTNVYLDVVRQFKVNILELVRPVLAIKNDNLPS
jgi:hypothetical protein